MPYSYVTPQSHGHGTVDAALAAVIADLEQGRHYLLDGVDVPTSEVTGWLLELGARASLGETLEPLAFCRSAGAESPEEFRVFPSHQPDPFAATPAAFDVTL